MCLQLPLDFRFRGNDVFMELDEQSKERFQKLEKLKELKGNPYPNDFVPVHTAAQIHQAYATYDAEKLKTVQEKFKIAGRVLGLRSFGKAAFLQIQDRTQKIQVYVAKDVLGDEAFSIVPAVLD